MQQLLQLTVPKGVGVGVRGGCSELAARLPSQSEVPARFCTSAKSLSSLVRGLKTPHSRNLNVNIV